MNHEENHHPHDHQQNEETNNLEIGNPEQNQAGEAQAKEMNPPMPPSVAIENEDGVSQPNVPQHEVLRSSEPDPESGDKTEMPSRH